MSATIGSTVDGGIDPPQLFGGGDGLGQAGRGVGLVEQRLPLEVAQFDEIAIDDPQHSHAGADQQCWRSRCPAPRSRTAAPGDCGQSPLAFLAQRRKTHLAGVAGEIGG